MAVAASKVYPNYTNLSEIKSFWLDKIAPNYFNFSDTNNYNAGIFGYVNEVMANSVEDAFNAVAVARREFYPVTAQYESSLYAMAALQGVEIPLTTPARCRCILILPQNEIITNSTENNGVFECHIDDCLKIYAGDLQFMLDYPITIISKRAGSDSQGNPIYHHTAHYDISIQNSLNITPSTRYISNKVIHENGTNYVAFFINCIRQLEMVEETRTVVKDSIMDTITMDIDFNGNLANFEVFYKETATSDQIQLKKVLINSATPAVPYVNYELMTRQKLRLIFKYNTVFVPKYNSEITLRIYTSEGASGNFTKCEDDVVASCSSERYPYNENFTFLGKISGSAVGGKDQPSLDEFKSTIISAYATNKTITTSNDLQLYFDEISEDVNGIKLLFKKKRDDPFIRLFSAFAVMKNSEGNVVPTNTLELECKKEDLVDDVAYPYRRLAIQPGTIWTYKNDTDNTIIPATKEDGSHKSILDIDPSDSTHYFVNPFLIGINVSPNNIGYYTNSVDKAMSIEYTYVNDDSVQQFMAGTLSLYRNALMGSNYYRFRIYVTPATDLETNQVITINDPDDPSNQIRATHNGRVVEERYYYDESIGQGYVRFKVEYDTDDENERYQYIQASNTLPINHVSQTGYEMNYAVGDRFVENDILATKRVTDLGKLVIIGDLSMNHDTTIDEVAFMSALRKNGYYCAFSIQGYDEETNGYIMDMYLSTTDEIDLSYSTIIDHGIFNTVGTEHNHISISMKSQIIEMNVLFNNDGENYGHKYSGFAGLNNYTLTNSYVSSEDDPFDFIGVLLYIRGIVDFYPSWVVNPNYLLTNQNEIVTMTDGNEIIATDPDHPIPDHGFDLGDNYTIVIPESPILGALWGMEPANYDYFTNEIARMNESIHDAYYRLENNFSIDNKFYNTYGRARFFTVGNQLDTMVPLDNVRCRLHFGVRLSVISSTEQFIAKFRQFIKDYIESNDRISTAGQDLYILNLIGELRNEFDEIEMIEYYGLNDYGHEAQKIIGPDLTDYQDEFVPEFLNLDTAIDANGNEYPAIIVEILP